MSTRINFLLTLVDNASNGLRRFGAGAEAVGRSMEGIGLRIGAMGLAANAGLSRMGLDLTSVATSAIDAEKSLIGIASTAGINGDAAKDVADKWGDALFGIAKGANQARSDVIVAFQDLVGKGINDQDALKMLAPIGRAATATSSNISDLASATAAGFTKLEIDAGRVGKALDIMAQAGDRGAFELKDMAQFFDMLTAKSADLGVKGEAALAQLAAAAQIARRGTGDAASAATNLANFLDKLNAVTTAKQFAKIGVDLSEIKDEARASGDFIGGMIAKIKELSGGDAAKISALFPDVQAGSFARQAVRDIELYRDIALDAAAATGVVGEKFDTQLLGTAEKLKGAQINLEAAISASDAIKKLSDALEGLSDWAAKNPDTAAMIGIGLATTAAVGLVGGAIVAGVGTLITTVGALSKALSGVATFMLANPVVAVILGVAVAGAAIYYYWDDITAALTSFWASTKALFSEGAEAVKKGFDALNPLPWIKDKFSAALAYLSGVAASWNAAGAGLIAALRAGITAKLAGALGIGEKISGAIDYLKGEVGKWSHIGKDLMQGLLDGIKTKYTEIVDRVKNLGSDMLKSIKDVLGIRSPSYEMQKVGEATGEGLEVGIKSTQDSVVDAALSLGSVAVNILLAKLGLIQDKVSVAPTTFTARLEEENVVLKENAIQVEKNITLWEAFVGRAGDAWRSVVAIKNNFSASISQSLTDGIAAGKEAGLILEGTYNGIASTLSNTFMSVAKDLRDQLKEMFNRLVLRPVIEAGVQGVIGPLTSVFGTLAGALGLGAAGSAQAAGTTGASGSGDLLSLASTLKTGYQAVSGFFSGGSASAATAGTTTAATSSASSAAPSAALGTAATYLGSAAAGFVVGKMISGGYSALGKSGNAAVIAGTAIGALTPLGPLGAIVGGAIGGVVNRLFGQKLKEVGLRGTFSDSGFSGENYTFSKGGLFASNKTTTSKLDAGMQASLDSAYSRLKGSAILLGGVFKDTSADLDDFSYALQLNFKGLDEKQSAALLTGELTKMGDAMAAQVLDSIARAELESAGMADVLAADITLFWRKLSRTGESASDTMNRLSGSLAGVNGWLERTGMALYATTLSAANMASGLVDLFGDMDKFNAALTGYTANYFTATERMNIATGDMTDQFAALGLVLPGTTEELRATIEAQDLTTASGRETFATLVQLSGGFKELTAAAGGAALNGRTLMKAWEEQGTTMAGLINTFDRSAASESQLTNVARSRYEIELALVKQIESALQSTQAMFANTIEEMKFSILDEEGKYNFLVDKSKTLETLFAAATDPSEIERLAGELNQTSRDAWMLLGDEEKKIKLASFETYLKELDALTTSKLGEVNARIKDEGSNSKNSNEAIADAISRGIESALARGAKGFEKAATAMKDAAETPVKVDNRVTVDVNVDMPSNVEVGIA
ncbi:phage tail tape measure protein [Candidatus Nitrotoga sp. M5]|uniref:phage tail tape measure protein n=1 Tax=Candidatus Nitrotoga sp. M5 TaxID=2890409 RepID=UPI001EF6A3DC|nr:phage tail tape measure protein [Candidatus Nitrotoga sp. M5]CAH1387018.1 hypothetical protein NTGM5_480014 [Candidatus Nitrotoga sp. M5]